jgi:multiple sugar transport system substrate-binding protein
VTVGIAPTPVGPSGARASMFNGLADSIWSGSKNQAAAWKWVKYLASPECQDTVGKAGVVFPAIPSGTEAAKAAFAAKGIDVSAFTTQVDDKTTFLFPITDHAAAIQQIMKPAMDNVLNGSADVSSLTEANDQVNALFPQ